MSRTLEICGAITLIGTVSKHSIGWFLWIFRTSPDRVLFDYWDSPRTCFHGRFCFQCDFSRFSGTKKMQWLHSFPPCWTSVQHCQIVKMCRGLEIVHQPLLLRQSLEEGLRYLLARGGWTEFRRLEHHPQLATSKVMIVPCCLLVKCQPQMFFGATRVLDLEPSLAEVRDCFTLPGPKSLAWCFHVESLLLWWCREA